MKIIECIDQLNKSVNICNTVYDMNNKISDILLYMDKNNPNVSDVRKIIRILTKDLPKIEPVPMDFVKSFSIPELKTFVFDSKNKIADIPNMVDSRYFNKYEFNNSIKIMNKILDTNNDIEAVILFVDTYEIFDNAESILLLIFKSCMLARNVLINYCNSLELPTMTDYEYKEMIKEANFYGI